MRECALIGLIAVAFGLGSYYATQNLSTFTSVNLAAGSLLLAIAAIASLRRLRIVGGPHSRSVIGRGLLWIVLALGAAIGLERAAARTGIRYDWTFEQSYALSPATKAILSGLDEPVQATLYRDDLDPRKRRTRLLLEQLQLAGPVDLDERGLDDFPDDLDRFAIGSSNTVVIEYGDRFETVERPTEGAIYEALSRLTSVPSSVITLLRGEGEGDPERSDDLGYSGLASALATEGYRLRSVVSAAMSEVPGDTDALLVIHPRRRLPDAALDAIDRYLEAGGSLIALLEPGSESGVEEILARWGLASPNAVVVDPASGVVESRAEGLNPVAYNFETHPVTRGLGRNRMAFFAGARSFVPRKPRVDDDVRGVVLASPRSWLSHDLSVLDRVSGTIASNGARQDYHPLAAVGRYSREGGETRIAAFGDSDFASNRYLRALYNLDLVLNAVHWTTERESAITLRPKIRDTVQFPLPLANTLQTLYGAGMLLPEVLLIIGGLVWLRRRVA